METARGHDPAPTRHRAQYLEVPGLRVEDEALGRRAETEPGGGER